MKHIENLLRKYSSLILSIEKVEETEIKNLHIIKLKITLLDYSTLYIREIWKKGKLIAYSYYWFDASNKLIEGWDNAPHHKEISTFPHHRHTKNGVKESINPSLKSFFELIKKRIL